MGYSSLRKYWEEENERFPYFIKEDEKYLGFVLVRYITLSDRSYFSMAEFFIMRIFGTRSLLKIQMDTLKNKGRSICDPQ
jgi:predicted acetyltransferase